MVSVGRLGQIRLWNLEQERAPAKKACQHCGAEKAWQSVPRGKRVFVERRQIEGMILQCNQCGRYTCYACAAEAGTETFVGDEKIGTELRCPACHAGPITQPQV